MNVLTTEGPSRGMAVLIWIGIALAVYGAAAVLGVGGLEAAVGDVPGNGVVGGFFVGLCLFAVPTLGAWAMGRRATVNPPQRERARIPCRPAGR